jgi:hypothetical protein
MKIDDGRWLMTTDVGDGYRIWESYSFVNSEFFLQSTTVCFNLLDLFNDDWGWSMIQHNDDDADDDDDWSLMLTTIDND